MSTRIIFGFAAMLGGSICGLASTFVYFAIIEKVNEKLPKEEQFEALWWYPTKAQRLHREYKRLYPEGRLLLKVHVLAGLMVACLVIAAWCLRFFPR